MYEKNYLKKSGASGKFQEFIFLPTKSVQLLTYKNQPTTFNFKFSMCDIPQASLCYIGVTQYKRSEVGVVDLYFYIKIIENCAAGKTVCTDLSSWLFLNLCSLFSVLNQLFLYLENVVKTCVYHTPLHAHIPIYIYIYACISRFFNVIIAGFRYT